MEGEIGHGRLETEWKLLPPCVRGGSEKQKDCRRKSPQKMPFLCAVYDAAMAQSGLTARMPFGRNDDHATASVRADRKSVWCGRPIQGARSGAVQTGAALGPGRRFVWNADRCANQHLGYWANRADVQ
ncbi:hypothetical protein AOX55_00002128 [Sinorhizobium fredii CCBAU 25509]|nr:hypothetical protein AOX55_00002128 [Sinorhizobium fredii CCBAU 25509]